VAAKLGYCGLDRTRLPLRGDEIRACWEGGTAVTGDSSSDHRPIGAVPDRQADDRTAVHRLEFIPVVAAPRPAAEAARMKRGRPGSLTPSAATGDAPPPPADVTGIAATPADARWSLWGELEG
jgi:hypothetical protein